MQISSVSKAVRAYWNSNFQSTYSSIRWSSWYHLRSVINAHLGNTTEATKNLDRACSILESIPQVNVPLPSSHPLTFLDQHGRCLSLRARFAVHFAGRTGRSASRQEFSIRTSIFRQRILGIRQSPLVPPFPRFSLVPACMDSTFSTSTIKSTVCSTFPPSISPTPRKSAPRSPTRRRTARTRTSSAGSASSPRISRSPARSGRFLMQ